MCDDKGGKLTVKVLVVGAGRMGSQIGCEYIIGGHTVTFLARDPVAAERRVQDGLELARGLGFTAVSSDGDFGSHTTFAQEPTGDYDLVVESLPEDLALKVSTLRPIAAQQPDAVIATNTSSLSITAIGDEIEAPERTIGIHYWNPPLLMPLVEVVAGAQTDPSVVRQMSKTLSALGKDPVIVERDVPGFIWNRLQLAVMREALWLVENAVASPEAIDHAVREGLARRWRHVGPFEAAALGGIDTWRRIGANLLPTLSHATDLAGLERWLPSDEATLDDVRRRRDAALEAELRQRPGAHSEEAVDGR